MTIPLNVTNPLSQFGVISFVDGLVKKKVVFSSLHQRLDFGLFTNEIGATLASSDRISELKKYFPELLSTKMEIKEIKESKKEEKDTEEIKKWSVIEKLLSDELGRYYFKAHATNEFSVENVIIYEEVAEFKGMIIQPNFKIENQIEKAKEIYDTFLKKNSILELNITRSLAKEYEESIKKLDDSDAIEADDLNNFFDKLIDEIGGGVLVDTYSRFLKSSYYTDYKNSNDSSTITYLK